MNEEECIKVINKIFGKQWKDINKISCYIESGRKRREVKFSNNHNEYMRGLTCHYNTWIAEGNRDRIIADIIDKILSVTQNCMYFSLDIDVQCFMILKISLLANQRYLRDNYILLEGLQNDDGARRVFIPIRDKKGAYPRFCRKTQDVLYGNRICIFQDIKNTNPGKDITRYGFGMVMDILEDIDIRVNDVKDEKNEGIENFIILDEIIGISLTNTIYYFAKNAKADFWNRIVKVSSAIAGINNLYCRNFIAQVIMMHLRCVDYDMEIVDGIMQFLDTNVRWINECMDDIFKFEFCEMFEGVEDMHEAVLCELSIFNTFLLDRKEIQIMEDKVLYNYSYFDKIKNRLPEKGRRIKISKKLKEDKYELYACIHQAVMLGIQQ